MEDSLHATGAQLGSDTTIHQLFAEQVAMDPHACALIEGTRSLSYRELDQASDEIARFLLDRGVAPEECVVVHAGRTIQMVAANLGILKAGACYVPLDTALPAGRRQFVLEDTNARLVLVDSALDSHAQSWPRDTQCYHIDEIWTSARAPAARFPRVGSANLAYVVYTSGSTGKPKGVLIEHRSVARLVKDNHYVPLERSDRMLLAGAIGFDATTFEIWGSLLNGLSLCLADLAVLNDAHSLKQALETWGITTLFATTAFCGRRIQEDPSVFRSLKYLLIGGEVLRPGLSNTIRRCCPGLRMSNMYGPTECTTFATSFAIDDEYSSSIPIGKPIRGTTAFIVDEKLALLRDGSAGEIVLGGEGLARGYLNRPELTRERFVAIAGLGRVYRTGDIGRRQEDGNIQFVGRRDRQVKIGGYRVELGEVEHALSVIEAVRDCTVRLVERNGEKFLAAYYVAAHPGIEPVVLKRTLAGVLPDHLLPTFLIELDALPLGQRGKIDQKALPDPFEESASPLGLAQDPVAASPDDLADVQIRVKQIWEQCFAVPDLHLDADFYAMGGTSSKAIHLLGAMTERGLDVSLSDILHHRTIRRLSAYVASTAKRGGPLKSWSTALVHLQEKYKGAQLRVGIYSVGEDAEHAREVVVLQYQNLPVCIQELLDTLASIISPELFPHYVREGAGWNGEKSGRVSGNELRELLGMQAAHELHLDELKARVTREYERNDDAIHGGAVVEECQFSPIQELQFSFRTPMSRGHFILDRPVNLALLVQAVRDVTAEQDLLMSVPIQKVGRHYWRKFAVHDTGALEPSVVDLSAYYYDDTQLVALVRELTGVFDFWEEGRVLYHVLIIKRNAREHAIVLVFNHVLFDRVSEEVIRRRVLTRYDELLKRRLPPPAREVAGSAPERPSYFEYVRQVQRGPVDVSASELIERYALRRFHAQKKRLLTACGLEPVDRSYSFQIAAPQAEHLEGGNSLGIALALYVKALGVVYGLDALPLLFIYEGRKYRGTGFYDIVGECIDYVPMLLETRLNPLEMQQQVTARLAALSTHNVNFLNLVNSPDLSEEWREIRELIDPGAGYSNIDSCMFNYLGNQPGTASYRRHYDPRIHAGPNPLPIHSHLNCIATSYPDGLIFNFRTSYTCDVEGLRAAFGAASRSW